MSTFASVFKEEIVRLARKETRAQTEPLRKASANYRRQIAELKRVLTQLQREVTTLGRARTRAAAAPAENKPTRFVAKGLRSLRTRLGLSAEELGALAGVSGQSIRNWEARKSTPGKDHRAMLASLRSVGKREARARLDQAEAKAAKGTGETRKG